MHAALRRFYWVLATVAQDDDARANEFRVPAKNPSDLDPLGDCGKAKPIIERLGDPAVPSGDVAEKNATMMIGHGVAVVWIDWPANELKGLARSNVFVGVLPPVDAARERLAL